MTGDIGSYTRGLAWAAEAFQLPVIYVTGNHEYYEAHLGMLAERAIERWPTWLVMHPA